MIESGLPEPVLMAGFFFTRYHLIQLFIGSDHEIMLNSGNSRWFSGPRLTFDIRVALSISTFNGRNFH